MQRLKPNSRRIFVSLFLLIALSPELTGVTDAQSRRVPRTQRRDSNRRRPTKPPESNRAEPRRRPVQQSGVPDRQKSQAGKEQPQRIRKLGVIQGAVTPAKVRQLLAGTKFKIQTGSAQSSTQGTAFTPRFQMALTPRRTYVAGKGAMSVMSGGYRLFFDAQSNPPYIESLWAVYKFYAQLRVGKTYLITAHVSVPEKGSIIIYYRAKNTGPSQKVTSDVNAGHNHVLAAIQPDKPGNHQFAIANSTGRFKFYSFKIEELGP